MFEILFRVKVKADNREAFLKFIREDICEAERRERGTLRFDLYQDEDDENAFFVYEAYRDAQAFNEHQENEPFKRWEKEIRPEMVTCFARSREGAPLLSLTLKSHETTMLPENPNYLAPDGSEIRLLPSMKRGGLCHCTLPAGKTSSAVSHHQVEEIWYVLEGDGEVWRQTAGAEETVRVSAGISLTIPPRTAFQFRSIGAGPLRILIMTMPPWPGKQEAIRVNDHWPTSGGDS